MAEPVTERDAYARAIAVGLLEKAAKRWDAEELEALRLGKYEEAEEHHKRALWCARAYWVERDDPRPEGLGG